MPEPSSVLLQARHGRIEPAVLRDVLMQDGGMPKVDASRASQKARGILADRLTQAQAERCQASLGRQGIPTVVMPAAEVVAWSKPLAVHWLRAEAGGLFVPTDYYGSGETIPWTSLFVVSSGLVTTTVEERTPTDVVAENSYHHRTYVTEWKSTRKDEHQHVTEMLGLSGGGQTMNFRLAAQRLHAQQVPQGGADAPRFQKYLLLLDAIVAAAAQAEISPETRQILAERRDVPREIEGKKPYAFDERGFESYNRWLFQMFLLREQGQAQ